MVLCGAAPADRTLCGWAFVLITSMYAYTARIMFSKKDDVQHTQIVPQPQLEQPKKAEARDPFFGLTRARGFHKVPSWTHRNSINASPDSSPMGCSCTVLSHSLPPSSTPAHAAGGGRPQLTDLTSAEHLLEGGTGGRS